MDKLTQQDLGAEILFDDSISFQPSLSSSCCCCTASTSETAEDK